MCVLLVCCFGPVKTTVDFQSILPLVLTCSNSSLELLKFSMVVAWADSYLVVKVKLSLGMLPFPTADDGLSTVLLFEFGVHSSRGSQLVPHNCHEAVQAIRERLDFKLFAMRCWSGKWSDIIFALCSSPGRCQRCFVKLLARPVVAACFPSASPIARVDRKIHLPSLVVLSNM